MDFEELGEVLKRTTREVGLEKRLKERRCLALWEEVVGEKVARVSQAVDIKKGVIYVKAKDPLWAQQIFNLKGLIIRKMNERMGEEMVKDIKIRAEELKEKKGKKGSKRGKEQKPSKEVQLTEEEKALIERMTRRLKDEKIRELIKDLIEEHFKMRKEKGI